MKSNKIIFLIIASTLIFSACSKKNEVTQTEETIAPAAVEDIVASDALPERVKVTFEVENYGQFVAETYPDYAPETVKQFLALVENGYYNGFEIAKIDHSYAMITSETPRDFSEDSAADFNSTVPGEFINNGRSNNLPLEKYTLALCHTPSNNDGGMAQFMIFLTDKHDSDGSYAGFAKVVEGTEVIDKMAGTLVDENDAPVSPIVMKKVSVND